MATIEDLKRRANALAGSPAPGDARAVARLIADLCDHLDSLENDVKELLWQMQKAQSDLSLLKQTRS